MVRSSNQLRETIYCAECGQEWKIKGEPLVFQYDVDYERWSSIIEDEANKVAKESGRTEKIRFQVFEVAEKDSDPSGHSWLYRKPMIKCDYNDYEALKFTVQAIRAKAMSMPIIERDFFLSTAKMFEEWVSRGKRS